MDKRSNQTIADAINRMMAWSGTAMASFALFATAILFGMYQYSITQWEDASGTYVVGQNNGIINTLPVVDAEHAFDDYVALVQSYTARNLTDMFNFTSATYGLLQNRLADTEGTFEQDALINLTNYKLTEAIEASDRVRKVKFEIIDSPLLIDGSSNGVDLATLYENAGIRPLNSLVLDESVLEIYANVSLISNGREVRRYKVRFIVTLLGVNESTWVLSAMSRWES
ncbi:MULTISPECIES: hypothetical protein [Vibrio]|uniref:hypothetical protein n=1 Tax=Vibrio TaxID=662 RepID=UPI001E59C3DE|nr:MULTISPECIES: hypothetical protein [Vibrio]MCC2524968.1 hypothetical protein [Vibrio coralliilyticus]USD35513.1 hypothetical protein J8Z27_23115 [Vibrio sp. SCSIO 43186]USD72637.1 hypothetical protein J4N41_23120 [Vibrio sp. SCSIO 43139]USD99028.1 hypothetical protein CTT30_23430 [Vibrio coralliilyticus]